MGNHIVELCFFFFFFFFFYVEGATINVKDHGVTGDGKTDDSQGFLKAWSAACASAGTVKLLVPKATYLIGPLTFQGPCKQASSFIFQHEGYLKATTDLNKYASDVWLRFAKIDHMTLTGGGTFDGQGASAWPHNSCPKNSKCKVLPTSLIFLGMTNTIIKGIKSVNSKFFHIGVVSCTNFHAESLHITAPGDSPNTDGIHITRSTHVKIVSSNIGTGDDCISIGDTSADVYISNIQCGPGHGISVGSLGKYSGEGDVKGLIVKDSTLTGTTNGVRIKSWMNAAAVLSVTNVTFSNVVMNNVHNPIIVDQKYCPFASCPQSTPSTIKITDLTFDGIRGSSMSPVAVKLICSKSHPCQNVMLKNIQLSSTSGTISSQCENVKPQYSGPQSPQPCK